MSVCVSLNGLRRLSNSVNINSWEEYIKELESMMKDNASKGWYNVTIKYEIFQSNELEDLSYLIINNKNILVKDANYDKFVLFIKAFCNKTGTRYDIDHEYCNISWEPENKYGVSND